MLDNSLVGVAIGLVIIFLLASLFCTVITEWIAQLFRLRAQTFRKGLANLIGEIGKAKGTISGGGLSFSQKIYEHRIVEGISRNKRFRLRGSHKRDPSYMSAETFTKVLIDVVDPNAKFKIDARQAIASIRSNVNSLNVGPLRDVLFIHLGTVETTLEEFQSNVAGWFDEGMDRVSGWYRRQIRWISFGVALLVAVGFNINTLHIADLLWKGPVACAALAKRAGKFELPARFTENVKNKDKREKILRNIQTQFENCERYNSLPIGWAERDKDKDRQKGWYDSPITAITWNRIIGWLISAIAISLGAPFWFDVLKKLGSIRAWGGQTEKKPKQPGGVQAPSAAGSAAPTAGPVG
ncbi:MAG: hypothetical protein O7I42_13015 [Alphaproteobacteria bacterium]|nr:hypothetical protein [Alphaproteobacteria bacterium]